MHRVLQRLHAAAATRRTAAQAFYRRNEIRMVTGVGLILIAATAFGAGVLASPVWQGAPLIIERTIGDDSVLYATTENHTTPTAASAKDCMFVGSRNSNTYYPPTCSFARRIAPENLRCFISAEDAEARGYVRSTGC